jgi:ribosomal protein L37AE/L43A
MKRSPLRRKTPLAKVGAKAKRERSDLDEFRARVRERAESLCEVGWWPVCTRVGTMAHHRCPADRDRGVHDPERGLWVCARCHEHIHQNPAESYAKGWLIRSS